LANDLLARYKFLGKNLRNHNKLNITKSSSFKKKTICLSYTHKNEPSENYFTCLLCRGSSCIMCLEDKHHKMTAPSRVPETRQVLSGLRAKQETGAECSSRANASDT